MGYIYEIDRSGDLSHLASKKVAIWIKYIYMKYVDIVILAMLRPKKLQFGWGMYMKSVDIVILAMSRPKKLQKCMGYCIC